MNSNAFWTFSCFYKISIKMLYTNKQTQFPSNEKETATRRYCGIHTKTLIFVVVAKLT